MDFARKGIPLGIYLAFKADMKLLGLWIGLLTALMYGAVVSTYLVLSADWDYYVKEVRDRVEADKHQDRHEGLGPEA